jgi:hypothetical protein
MNKLDANVVQHLKAIEATCPRLLNALHHTPEALWGEIQSLELACQSFEQALSGLDSAQIQELVSDLRAQMARQGLMDNKELEAFRQKVAAVQSCAKTLMQALR